LCGYKALVLKIDINYIAFFYTGCQQSFDTLDEVMKNAKEAIDLYLETLTVAEKKDLLKEKVVSIKKISYCLKFRP